MTGPLEVSGAVARFLLESAPDIAVREHARALVAAAVSAASARADAPALTPIGAVIDRVADGPTGPLGSDQRTDGTDAAFLTAAAAAAAGSDEPGHRIVAAVVAAAAARAELGRSDADALVDAVAVGVEIGLRMAESVGQPYLDRGWDVTGVAGSVGSAAAVARLDGASHGTTLQVLGVAATQGAGLRAAAGTDTWPLHVGRAAAGGFEAAMLCTSGFSGPPAGIEGRRGFLPVAAPEGDATRLTDGLGERWSLLDQQPDPAVAVMDGMDVVLKGAPDVIARIREVSRSGIGRG